jgi:hypothetical protein
MSEEPVVPYGAGPTPNELDRVERSVLALGGKVLEDPCRAEHQEDLGHDSYTSGCGGLTRVVIPYDGPGKFITLCAVCDSAHLMEKFK